MRKDINWKELLQMFCDNCEVEMREWMTKPFLNKPFNEVWATDGHIALMVNPKVCGADFDVLEKPLDWTQTGRKWEDGLVVTIDQIKETLDKCPKEEEVDSEEKECPECGGCGKVEWEYTASYGSQRFYEAEYECPVCEGSGIMEEEHSHPTGRMVLTQGAAVRIGNAVFRGLQMERIIEAADMMGVSEIRLLHLPKPGDFHNNGMILAFSPDVRLLLMPFLTQDEADIVTLPVVFKED